METDRLENAVSEHTIEVADISIRMTAVGNHFGFNIHPIHQRFATSRSDADIDLAVHYGALPAIPDLGKVIFDSGGLWSLYSLDDKYLVPLVSPAISPDPYQMIVIDKGLESGELFIKPTQWTEAKRDKDGRPMVNPLNYPIDELLVINKLSDGRGVDIHGCAIDHNSRGLLFIGVSGAGKSTLANIWKIKDVDILSDDRLIVKPVADEFWVFGTPWHGDAGISMPKGQLLDAMYFLKQGKENSLRRLSHAEATSRLLVCCFPTFYFKDAMETTMQLLADICERVPAYEFGFVPDQSAIEFVDQNMATGADRR